MHRPRVLAVVAGRHGASGGITAAPARSIAGGWMQLARDRATRHADVLRLRRDRDVVRRWGGDFVDLIAEAGEPTTAGT